MQYYEPQSYSRDGLLREILEHREIQKSDLLGKRRFAHLSQVRHEIAYWLRMRTSMSLFAISKAIGVADHKTVLYGVYKYAQTHNAPLPASGNRLDEKFDEAVSKPSEHMLKILNLPKLAERTKCQPWEDREVKIMSRMVKDHKTDAQIAMTLGRGVHSVKSKIKRLQAAGLKKRPIGGKKTVWTEEMERKLAEMWPLNKSLAQISKVLGCTESACTSRANLLGLYRNAELPMEAGPAKVSPVFFAKPRSSMAVHPMWSMDEADRRAAFIEKFEAGMAVIRAMAEVRANA